MIVKRKADAGEIPANPVIAQKSALCTYLRVNAWASRKYIKMNTRQISAVRVIDAIARACALLSFGVCALAAPPTFDCDKVSATIEKLICMNDDLATLDRELSRVYAESLRRSAKSGQGELGEEQASWIKTRNDCWKSREQARCVQDSYRTRIAELQAKHRLVQGNGPVTYVCDNDPSRPVMATFFRTDPPTIIATRGNEELLMYLQPSGSGSKYDGLYASLWEHHGEALISWGHNEEELLCTIQF